MADTLAEIYRNTLTESDFDSNGEATIVTTDSSTSHVVKAVQVVEGNSKVPVAGNIDVNGFNVVALTGNSSGTEIIAPSSTVKVKTSNFPLDYLDGSFVSQTSSSAYATYTDAKINNVVAIEGIEASGLSIGHGNITSDDTSRAFGFNLGPNNTSFIYVTNTDNDTPLYLYNSSGNIIAQATESYTPKWFDGVQYVYWYSNQNIIQKMDVFTGSVSTVVAFNAGQTPDQYARMFGVKDEYLFFWPTYSSNFMYAYSFVTNTVKTISSSDPQYALNGADHSRHFYAAKTSTGYKWINTVSENDLRCWNWSDGTVFNSAQYVSVTGLSTDSEILDNVDYLSVTVGSKFYYRRRTGRRICYIDMDSSAPEFGGVLSTSDISFYAGADLSYQESTPSSATIAARDYGTAPSLGLRITGVTST